MQDLVSTQWLAAELGAPDLVVLDLSMPGTDGLMVLEQMREWPETAATPLMAFSKPIDAETILPRASAPAAPATAAPATMAWEPILYFEPALVAESPILSVDCAAFSAGPT